MRYFNNEVYFYTNPFISILIPKSCPITIYGIVVATFKIILIFLFIRDYLIILYRGGIYICIFSLSFKLAKQNNCVLKYPFKPSVCNKRY